MTDYKFMSKITTMITNPPDDFSEQFKQMLNKNKLTANIIETLYGTALDRGNNVAIALINFYVRENKITINTENIYREAYYAECSKYYAEGLKNGCRAQYASYEEVKHRVKPKYKNIFKESKFPQN